jgi:hypothetical protein
MPCPSDLTDDQWDLLEPLFNAPGKRGRKHADDLRTVVNAMLYIAQTGCQWRYLPESFGPWTLTTGPHIDRTHGMAALSLSAADPRIGYGRIRPTTSAMIAMISSAALPLTSNTASSIEDASSVARSATALATTVLMFLRG